MGFNLDAVMARALLTPEAMARADERTIAAGTSRRTLVARAARAVFEVIRGRYSRRLVTVLAGPGHNGDDGLALARLLEEAGWPVTIIEPHANEEEREARKGLEQRLRPSGTFMPRSGTLVVDALFGAGLSRPVDGEAGALLDRLAGSGAEVLAIDLPSGLNGATGEILGTAARADLTVTFHRLKPGHLIGDGPGLCGDVFLREIGIAASSKDAAALWNHPSLWAGNLKPGSRETHKYKRGHVAVIGGPGLKGGAARLAARGAAVSGAGAVTFFSPVSSAEFAAASFDAVMVRALSGLSALEEALEGTVSAVTLGPGMGHSPFAGDILRLVLEKKVPCVLDADALTFHEDDPEALFALLHPHCILTPHEGEFARLFPDLEGDKLGRTGAAAERAGATVLLKGSSTVIAGEGLPVISTMGGPALATAGSGDTLAGLIGGFLAQGLDGVGAAAAGAYVHGLAGTSAGPNLTADELPWRIADTLNTLLDSR
jgi:NAD(P)H-hydrate epimerase